MRTRPEDRTTLHLDTGRESDVVGCSFVSGHLKVVTYDSTTVVPVLDLCLWGADGSTVGVGWSSSLPVWTRTDTVVSLPPCVSRKVRGPLGTNPYLISTFTQGANIRRLPQGFGDVGMWTDGGPC